MYCSAMPWKTTALTPNVNCPTGDINGATLYKYVNTVDDCTNKCSRHNAAAFAYNWKAKECWCKHYAIPTERNTTITCYTMRWEEPPPPRPNYESLARGIPYEMRPYTSTVTYYEENPRVLVDENARNVEDCKRSCIIDNKTSLAEYLCAYTEFITDKATCRKVYVHNPSKQTKPFKEYDTIQGVQYHIASRTY